MGAPAADAIVLVQFPFSDLLRTKLRPAVVLADAGRGDYVLCQITSKPYGDIRAVKLEDANLAKGLLRVTRFARPGKLFTASRDLIKAEVATLDPQTLKQVVEAVTVLLRVGRR